MRPATLMFLGLTLVAIGGRLLGAGRARAVDRGTLLLVPAGITQIAIDGAYWVLMPVYGIAFWLVVLALRRARRASPPSTRGYWKWVRTTLAALGGLVAAASALVLLILAPLTNDPNELFGATEVDLSRYGWSEAFRRAHEQLERDYAFGDWKRIDWAGMYARAAPRIAAAEARRDTAGFYLALRQYVFSIPDGHVDLDGPDRGVKRAAVGGGFGFTIVKLDDGRTIAQLVDSAGPAGRAGMRWGAEILRWNGAPIDSAVAHTPTLWLDSPPATLELTRLAQRAFVVRAGIDSSASATWRNLNDTAVVTRTLTAVSDSFRLGRRALQLPSFSLRRPPIEWQVRPDSIGYIAIHLEFPTLGGLFPDREMREAMQAFTRRAVRGVILDLRGNGGGSDKLVTELVGYFFDRPSFYEHATFYDPRSRRFAVRPGTSLTIQPQSPFFAGPVVAIIDPFCVSSCEGIALAVQRLRRGSVVGWYGTYGSFGMSGAEVHLPAELAIGYPNGQSVDSSGRVQLDSDTSLAGGVAPSMRVPIDLSTVRATFVEGRDVLLEAAVRLIAPGGRP